jgi:hypothetical protein
LVPTADPAKHLSDAAKSLVTGMPLDLAFGTKRISSVVPVGGNCSSPP